MKTLVNIMLPALLVTAGSCSGDRNISLNVDSATPRSGAMVEIPVSEILESVGAKHVRVLDPSGKEIPSQITYDSLLIFHAGEGSYTIMPSDRKPEYETMACGRLYPERADDIAWENDLVGFRAYGPATQRKGEKAFGYDIFFKYPGKGLVVEELYRPETDPATWVKVDSLRAIDNQLAEDYIKTFSYHIDHGKGMDCYAVGPTLGAGVAALMPADSIAFPWCYDKARVLDNGPLRFTVSMDFLPAGIGNDSAVVEHRIITLDAGSRLNRTRVWYDGLSSPAMIAAGVPRRDDSPAILDSENGFIAYADPTQGTDNGKAILAVYFPDGLRNTREQQGHILGITGYNPGDTLTYYWGFSWSRAGGISDLSGMKEYILNF